MDLHPAENRGYRELYVTGSATARRFDRLARAFPGRPAEAALTKASAAVQEMLAELRPLTASHDLHSRVAAEGGGAGVGVARAAIFDRFLERNQALRFAIEDVEHIANLLGYLARVSATRGDAQLEEFCASWERRMRRQVSAVRKAAIELGADPDFAVLPLDESPAGRAAHRSAWAFGTFGEWIDRQLAHRRSDS